MKILSVIPNSLTSCNLLCGCIAILLFGENELIMGSYFIFIATIFDFLDGFAARLLKVQSALGEQLDSLADMVTFGVAPAFLAYKLFHLTGNLGFKFLPFIAFMIAIFSAVRLAKFNIDDSQSDSFVGIPTPANALVWASIPFILEYYLSENGLSLSKALMLGEIASQTIGSEYYFSEFIGIGLILLIIVSSLWLVMPLRLIALKFKSLSWHNNQARFIFIILSLLTIIFCMLKKMVFISIPFILTLYLIISIINNLVSRKNEIQS